MPQQPAGALDVESQGVHPNGLPSPSTVPTRVPDVVGVACRFAQARKRPAVVYLLGEDPDVPITRKTVEQVASALDDDGPFDQLDLVIQSSGGDIHAAYQMMKLLRSRMANRGDRRRQLAACVPRRAASAATLLCLGADQILLGEIGTLSPLDAQVQRGDTPMGTPNYISALHLLHGLARLRDFSFETFGEFAARLHDRHGGSQELLDYSLRYSIEFTRAITAPLLKRIDSPNVGFWEQMLKTGEEYGRRLLELSTLMEGLDPIGNLDVVARRRRIENVVDRLVNKYPSHEMIIDRDELKQLGLSAELVPEDLRAIIRAFASCSSETLVMVVYPPGVKAPFDDADVLKLEEWRLIGYDGKARNVTCTDGGNRFYMRVGLYRPQLPSNPWRPSPEWNGDRRGMTSAWYRPPGPTTGSLDPESLPPPDWPPEPPKIHMWSIGRLRGHGRDAK